MFNQIDRSPGTYWPVVTFRKFYWNNNGPWWLWDALTEYLQEVELLLDVVLLQDVELLQDLDNLQDVELAQDLELAVNFFSSVSDNPKDFFNELWYQKSPQKDFYI